MYVDDKTNCSANLYFILSGYYNKNIVYVVLIICKEKKL